MNHILRTISVPKVLLSLQAVIHITPLALRWNGFCTTTCVKISWAALTRENNDWLQHHYIATSAAIVTGERWGKTLWMSAHRHLIDIVTVGRSKYYVWRERRHLHLSNIWLESVSWVSLNHRAQIQSTQNSFIGHVTFYVSLRTLN